MLLNPFITGNIVPSERFIGRENEIRRLRGKILTGSFVVILGDPRIGKTSLLKYLYAPQKLDYLYGDSASKLHFCYMNAHTFDEIFEAKHFWKKALEFAPGIIAEAKASQSLANAYKKCTKSHFLDYPAIDYFFKQLDSSGHCLVLLLDEFDVVLENPKLNTKAFLGHLRTLASCYRSLACIAAARQSVIQLNNKTKGYADGSPYFNVLEPITLTLFCEKDVEKLLEWAGEQFNVNDRRYLLELTGGHPFLLQVAASELWEAYIEIPDDVGGRYRQVEGRLYEIISIMFSDIWKAWSPEMRMAFCAVGLSDMSSNDFKFNNRNLLKYVNKNLNPELEELERRGLIASDTGLDRKRHVRSLISLWWIADQLVQEIRDESSFRAWLQKQ